MEITLTELFLFTWAIIATIMWQQCRHELGVHRFMTGEVFKRIAQGRIKVVDKKDSFDLVEVNE